MLRPSVMMTTAESHTTKHKPYTNPSRVGWAEGKGLTTSQLPLKVQSPHPTEDRFRGSTWCTEGRLKFVTWWVYGEVVSES